MRQSSKIDNIQDALRALGVTNDTLNAEERKSLDELGYVIFPKLINPEWLINLQNAYEELMRAEGQNAGKEFNQEAGTRRLSDLINKGEVFDQCWMHPKILAVAYHVTGRDFKTNSINGRDALPGQGLQGLHADWGPRVSSEPYHGVNALMLLDDYKINNGATRIVPGTHKLNGSITDYVKDVTEPHPDEIIPLLEAGSVIVYNFHLWHGGTLNQTTETRRVLHPSFIAREFKQQYDQRVFLRKSTYDRISPAARYLLDVE